MKYFGPDINIPLQESGIMPNIEVAPLDSAELLLGSKDDVVSFLANRKTGVILFDATGELLRPLCHFNIILLGGHQMSGQERDFVKARNIQIFQTSSVLQEGIANICDAVMEAANQWPQLHICVNLSIVDQQSGGLTARELLYFVQRLRRMRNYASASVVGIPSPLASKLISELA
ncbi:MAG: arginase family protein [Candidatus Woesearchaeota archaeon]